MKESTFLIRVHGYVSPLVLVSNPEETNVSVLPSLDGRSPTCLLRN